MKILAGMTTQSRGRTTLRASSSLLTSVNKMIADCVHKLELSAKRYSKDSVKLGIDYIDCEIGAYALDVYFRPIVEGSHKSKDLTYVISINTFYEESLQFTLWTASYSNPRNVRTVKQMGDLDYSEYTAYDVYKVLFASDLNKKALQHPDSTGGFSKAFYTFYEKRLYPSLGGDDKLGKMLSSTRINATIVDFMEKIKDYYGIADNKIKFQLMPVADAHASSMRYDLSGFGDALFFLVKHPKIKEDLWCKVYDSMSSGKIVLFFRDGETWTGYYVPKDPTYSLPPFMKGLEAVRWQTTLDSKSKKAVEAMIYGWKYYIRNTSDSTFSRI